MKLVVAEDETAALRAWLGAHERLPVSATCPGPSSWERSVAPPPTASCKRGRCSDSITLTDLPTSLSEDAGRLDPTILRTLDAIHLAAALDLGDDLQAIVTYDDRLAEAARSNGVAVLAPS